MCEALRRHGGRRSRKRFHGPSPFSPSKISASPSAASRFSTAPELSVSRGGADLPRRPQRLRQVDAAQDRRGRDEARFGGLALRAAGRLAPLPAAGAGPLTGFDDDPGLCRGRASGPLDNPYRALSLLNDLGLTGDEDPASPVGRRGAAGRRWPACWRPSPTSCCSTSRPTTSTCPSSNGWNRSSRWPALGADPR